MLAGVFAFGVALEIAVLPIMLAAGDGDVGIDPGILGLVNLGVLGVFTVAWLRGWVKTGADYAEQRTRAEAAEQRERDMQNALRTEVVPAMLRFTDTASRVLERDGRDTRGA